LVPPPYVGLLLKPRAEERLNPWVPVLNGVDGAEEDPNQHSDDKAELEQFG